MKVTELREVLDLERVREQAYDLTGKGWDDAYCLERSDAGWVVYARERGSRFDERFFESEDEAVAYFLENILRDLTTRHP